MTLLQENNLTFIPFKSILVSAYERQQNMRRNSSVLQSATTCISINACLRFFRAQKRNRGFAIQLSTISMYILIFPEKIKTYTSVYEDRVIISVCSLKDYRNTKSQVNLLSGKVKYRDKNLFDSKSVRHKTKKSPKAGHTRRISDRENLTETKRLHQKCQQTFDAAHIIPIMITRVSERSDSGMKRALSLSFTPKALYHASICGRAPLRASQWGRSCFTRPYLRLGDVVSPDTGVCYEETLLRRKPIMTLPLASRCLFESVECDRLKSTVVGKILT